jgi:hypothetical protein
MIAAVAPLAPATTVATVGGPRLAARGVIAVAAGLGVLCVALVVIRTQVGDFDIGFGSRIGNLGLSLQLATVIAGVIAIHTSGHGRARAIFVIEGAVCLLCYGWLGVVYAVGMLAWYAILGTRWLGRWPRAVIAFAALSGMNACGFIGGAWRAGAVVFSMIFTMRMLMYAWDRWQNDLERPPLFEYLFYMLPAPLVVMPPYMLIIPAFGNFARRFAPGLSAHRVGQIARHLALCALFGGVRASFALIGIEGHGAASLYLNLLSGVSAARPPAARDPVPHLLDALPGPPEGRAGVPVLHPGLAPPAPARSVRRDRARHRVDDDLRQHVHPRRGALLLLDRQLAVAADRVGDRDQRDHDLRARDRAVPRRVPGASARRGSRGPDLGPLASARARVGDHDVTCGDRFDVSRVATRSAIRLIVARFSGTRSTARSRMRNVSSRKPTRSSMRTEATKPRSTRGSSSPGATARPVTCMT